MPEIPLAVQPDDMTRKHLNGEQVPLERAQISEGESKAVPKRAFPALKAPSICKGLKGSEELYFEVPHTTAVDGISHADCTRSTDQWGFHFSSRRRDGP